MQKGSLGTWERLRSPPPIGQTKGDTGTPTPGHPRGSLAAGVSECAKHEGVSRAERNEARETGQGSRSVFIVARAKAALFWVGKEPLVWRPARWHLARCKGGSTVMTVFLAGVKNPNSSLVPLGAADG